MFASELPFAPQIFAWMVATQGPEPHLRPAPAEPDRYGTETEKVFEGLLELPAASTLST